MKVLALDCAAKTVSVAIAENGELLANCFYNVPLTHSQTLLPIIGQALSNTQLTLKELDALALSVGPGSFTGIRIGVSVVKGLAFAQNKPVFAFSALQTAALGCAGQNGVVLALTDARAGRYYAAFFKVEQEKVTRLTKDEIIPQKDLEKRIELDYNSNRMLLVGDGARLFAQNAPGLAVPVPPTVRLPSAAGMAVYSSVGTAGEPISPAALQPVYLIQSQAQRERQTHN